MTLFGSTAQGHAVQRLTMTAGDLSVSLLTLGAILQDVRLAGVAHGLTPGSDDPADYEGQMRYHGPVCGPVVNRISGGAAAIAGKYFHFEANEGAHTLHGGSAGTHRKLWDIVAAGVDHATLSLTLPDGDGGFPGNRRITAGFAVMAPATLRMTLTATTDAPTLMNLANHSYWNLDGTACWSGHGLRVAADRILPITADFLPTGDIDDVTGTPYDLRRMREISVANPPLDNNFCLAHSCGPLRDVLWLRGRSGVEMTVATTQPGIQVYDGRNARRPGRAPYEGLAIEAQHWPDAPNHPAFPSIGLAPGETYTQVTEWRFTHP